MHAVREKRTGLALIEERIVREWLAIVVAPCCQVWVVVRFGVPKSNETTFTGKARKILLTD